MGVASCSGGTQETPPTDPGAWLDAGSSALDPEMTLGPITCAAAGSGVCQEHRTGAPGSPGAQEAGLSEPRGLGLIPSSDRMFPQLSKQHKSGGAPSSRSEWRESRRRRRLAPPDDASPTIPSLIFT